jgi:putative intracellular protease/amidase
MIRGHPGLRALIADMRAADKPIGAVGRGLKLLLTTGILDGYEVTCAPEMRDDVIESIAPITYRDQPVVHDRTLITAQGTEDLPAFTRTLIESFCP